MIENCKITVNDGITCIQFGVAPTYQEALRVIDELADKYPYEYRLWDFSNLQFDFSMTEIRDIAEYGKRKFRKQNRLAMVAPDDLAYGELRAFEVYREEDGHATARVFRTIEEATDWLAEHRRRSGQAPASP